MGCGRTPISCFIVALPAPEGSLHNVLAAARAVRRDLAAQTLDLTYTNVSSMTNLDGNPRRKILGHLAAMSEHDELVLLSDAIAALVHDGRPLTV